MGANTLTGTVNAGTDPVAGATVQLWASGATSVTQISVSVTTDASGTFSVNYNCPADPTLMYVTSIGGTTTDSVVANPHITMASALGLCSTLPASIVVNELTSTTAAYAFGGLAPAAGSGAVSLHGNNVGLSNAYLVFSELVNTATGTFSTSGTLVAAPHVNNAVITNATAVEQKLNTVADALTACNNSNNGSATSAVCAELFACSTANAVYASNACTGGTSTAPTDTLNAALSIVQNAGLASPAGIINAASMSSAYSPVVAAIPNDWAMPLIYSSRNFGPLAIDELGNVWLLSSNPNSGTTPLKLSVIKLDPTGTVQSTATTGFTGGGIGTIDSTDTTNLAIDASGNVWVGGSAPNIGEINNAGAAVAPAGGWIAGSGPNATAGVAFDPSGDAWFASGNASSVFEVSSTGTNKSGTNGFAASVCDCNGIAADSAGDMWLIGPTSGIAEMSTLGVQAAAYAPPSGSYLEAIAGDPSGNFWVTDKQNHGIWKFTTSSHSFGSAVLSNNAGGGTLPKSIVIDGAGHKWVANEQFNSNTPSSVTEFNADGSLNLSPVTGFGSGVVAGAHAVAVDQSGNLWLGDGGTYVIEFIGAGAPTKNPIVSAVASGVFTP